PGGSAAGNRRCDGVRRFLGKRRPAGGVFVGEPSERLRLQPGRSGGCYCSGATTATGTTLDTPVADTNGPPGQEDTRPRSGSGARRRRRTRRLRLVARRGRRPRACGKSGPADPHGP
ncbi:unnamed protein product, partial [Ectocarpus sp. 12 AP-2014]